MEEILGSVVTPRQISVETLDYPFDLIEEIIEASDVSVCLDFGHLILYKQPIVDYARRYLARATVIHLHGVKHGRDHLSLDMLNENQMRTISAILDNFKGTVCIEVFSFHDLITSLEVLEQYCGYKR
jgi:sugar phosphate isomerase/epimerase